MITIDPQILIKALSHLLSMRAKAADDPCSSEQHWCDAIALISNMIPEYQPSDPEHLYDFKASLLNQDVLHGRMTSDEALRRLNEFEPKGN